jgi:hypothetical protein
MLDGRPFLSMRVRFAPLVETGQPGSIVNILPMVVHWGAARKLLQAQVNAVGVDNVDGFVRAMP